MRRKKKFYETTTFTDGAEAGGGTAGLSDLEPAAVATSSGPSSASRIAVVFAFATPPSDDKQTW